MNGDERRNRPSHHVVHDCVNLVSAGEEIKRAPRPPLNTHVGHAFYMNCRKMYEFFTYEPSKNLNYDDLRAREFTRTPDVDYVINVWTSDIQEHMNKQLMQVTRDRIKRTMVWEGHAEKGLFLEEFKAAWKPFFDNLTDTLKAKFREEIDLKRKEADWADVVLYSGD